MYVEWNPSPTGAKVGDCAVRAVSKALDTDWQTAYAMLCIRGMELYDMPNSNAVINAVLTDNGFDRKAIPMTCPYCYTVEEFAKENPSGTYVLGTGDHVVCVTDGDINDSWDSSKEIPIYYWEKRRTDNGKPLRNDLPNADVWTRTIPSTATHLD